MPRWNRQMLNGLLVSSLIFAAACGGSTPADRSAGNPTDDGAEQAVASQEDGGGQAAESADELAARLAREEEDLAMREKEVTLEERQAELTRREAELARREAAAKRESPNRSQPAPAPAREPEPRVEPQPAEPEIAASPVEPAEPAVAPRPEPRRVPMTIPAGTRLEVEILDTVSSEISQVGDPIAGRIAVPVTVDGRTAIPSGSRVEGRVTEVVPSRKIGGTARLGFTLDRLILGNGERVALDTAFVEEGKGQAKKDAATIGGAAAGGAILGRVIKKGDKTKGTVVGAILGAAVGTAIAANNEGQPVVVEPGTVILVELQQWVRVTVLE